MTALLYLKDHKYKQAISNARESAKIDAKNPKLFDYWGKALT